jgi:hypothetical protein
MSQKRSSKRVSLAEKYGLRGNLLVEKPGLGLGKTYYATSLLKGGKHSYAGKLVTRSSRDGKIISVEKLDKETT